MENNNYDFRINAGVYLTDDLLENLKKEDKKSIRYLCYLAADIAIRDILRTMGLEEFIELECQQLENFYLTQSPRMYRTAAKVGAGGRGGGVYERIRGEVAGAAEG